MLKSVLVIDDENEVRNNLSVVLTDEGYLVETAENGKIALEKCKKKIFHLALVDINLPDINGTELVQKLKLLLPRMITIIVTGYPTVENAIKAVNQNADGYILKPIKIPELLETITRRLNQEQAKYFRVLREVENFKAQTSFKTESPDETPSTIQEKNEPPTSPISKVQVPTAASAVPSGCKMRLGYLSERDVNIPVPEFCYTCQEILQCMRKKDE